MCVAIHVGNADTPVLATERIESAIEFDEPGLVDEADAEGGLLHRGRQLLRGEFHRLVAVPPDPSAELLLLDRVASVDDVATALTQFHPRPEAMAVLTISPLRPRLVRMRDCARRLMAT